jgi:hypothetical protein
MTIDREEGARFCPTKDNLLKGNGHSSVFEMNQETSAEIPGLIRS